MICWIAIIVCWIASSTSSIWGTHQRRNEINAWHVVDVVNFDVARDTFVTATLDGAFEYVGIIEVLHRLRAEIDAEVLQLARFRILKSKHVQDADETVRGMSHGVIQCGHTPGSRSSCNSRKSLSFYPPFTTLENEKCVFRLYEAIHDYFERRKFTEFNEFKFLETTLLGKSILSCFELTIRLN